MSVDSESNIAIQSIGEFEINPEELVRDNPKFSVFFKMLRMGVPFPAVKIKMLQKGVNPMILDLGEDALMSRVIALEKALESKPKEERTTSKPNQVLHWEVIPTEKLKGPDSIFTGGGLIFSPESVGSVAHLLELFQKKKPNPAVVATETEGGVQPLSTKDKLKAAAQDIVVSSLDSRRVQSVSILMKKLHLTASAPQQEFVQALLTYDQVYLTANKIELLLGCPLWPMNEEESKVCTSASKAGPDMFFYMMKSQVPDVTMRINSLAFRWEFENSIVETMRCFLDVKRACKLVLASAELKLVCQAAVFVGNQINGNVNNAQAITLGSLVKLSTSKAFQDKELSAMDVLALYCIYEFPADGFTLAGLLPSITLAKKCELEIQTKSVREMRRGVEAVRKIKELEEFAYEAMRRLDQVESEMGVARDFYGMVLKAFGANAAEMGDTNVFFEVLFAFVNTWQGVMGGKQQKIAKDLKAEANSKRLLEEKEWKQLTAAANPGRVTTNGAANTQLKSGGIAAQLKNMMQAKKNHVPSSSPSNVAASSAQEDRGLFDVSNGDSKPATKRSSRWAKKNPPSSSTAGSATPQEQLKLIMAKRNQQKEAAAATTITTTTENESGGGLFETQAGDKSQTKRSSRWGGGLRKKSVFKAPLATE